MDVVACTKNILSLCSGVGGLDIGIDIATGGRIRPVCYVEREAFAAAILATRMEQGDIPHAPIWSDVGTFDAKPWRGIVHGIVAGYPCQPFSTAGVRRGEHDPRHLWPHIVRIIGEIEPEFVFFENVAGHLTLGFDTVAKDLDRMGFQIAAGLFTAAEVGAPHRRERLFILGLANNPCVNGQWEMGSERRNGSEAFGNDGGKLANASCEYESHNTNELWTSHNHNVGGKLANTIGGNGIVTGCACKQRNTQPQSGTMGIFPPGPADRARWEEILSRRPDLAPAVEPAIHRMDDGMANRTHRLRAIGNGVVPLCAATAFVSLCAVIDATREHK